MPFRRGLCKNGRICSKCLFILVFNNTIYALFLILILFICRQKLLGLKTKDKSQVTDDTPIALLASSKVMLIGTVEEEICIDWGIEPDAEDVLNPVDSDIMEEVDISDARNQRKIAEVNLF